MSAPNTLETCISVRVSTKLRSAFHRSAKRHGKPSDVLRELMLAFVEGRLTVTPSQRKGIL